MMMFVHSHAKCMMNKLLICFSLVGQSCTTKLGRGCQNCVRICYLLGAGISSHTYKTACSQKCQQLLGLTCNAARDHTDSTCNTRQMNQLLTSRAAFSASSSSPVKMMAAVSAGSYARVSSSSNISIKVSRVEVTILHLCRSSHSPYRCWKHKAS